MLADVWLTRNYIHLAAFRGRLCASAICASKRDRVANTPVPVLIRVRPMYILHGSTNYKEEVYGTWMATDKRLLRVPRAPLHVENRSSSTFPASPVFSPSFFSFFLHSFRAIAGRGFRIEMVGQICFLKSLLKNLFN